MNRYLTFSLAVSLTLGSLAIPLRAANRPHAGTHIQNRDAWTNEDLERLHGPGVICVVGRTDEDRPKSQSPSRTYVKTRDPEWYARQAARLRDQLERRNAQLGGYRQAIADARNLKTMTGGINLEEGNLGITPEAGIEILQQRVSETQSELDALEDLARRNDIPPGALRGQ